MERNELVLLRLSNQYLLRTGERMEVLRAMNGFQAQFLSNALYAMRLRSTAYDTAYAADSLVKSWTLRGTMHIFAEADLPLFLHTGCRYRSRDWTVPSFWNQRPNWALTPKRQAYFSDLIIDALAQGPMTREALKARCRAAGMTQAEEGSIFHPWGGGIRELCERGFLCGTVSEEKAFRRIKTPRLTVVYEVFHELWPGFRPGRSLLFRFLAGGDQKAAGPASRGGSRMRGTAAFQLAFR